MKGKQKHPPSLVAGTTGEEKSKQYIDSLKLRDGNHKRCHHCNGVIQIKDNYCIYCGVINQKWISQ